MLALLHFLNPFRRAPSVPLKSHDAEGPGMAGSEDLYIAMRGAVDEMDRCLGWRNAGIAISGMGVPSFKHIATHEDPTRFTIRVLVAPVIGILGYGEIRGPFPDRPIGCAGSAVVASAMNRPLDEGRLLEAMRSMGCDAGITTDGFRWTMARRSRGGLVMHRADLRPYYVEILERRRFRTAVPEPRDAAVRFVRTFARERPENRRLLPKVSQHPSALGMLLRGFRDVREGIPSVCGHLSHLLRRA